LIFEVELLGIE